MVVSGWFTLPWIDHFFDFCLLCSVCFLILPIVLMWIIALKRYRLSMRHRMSLLLFYCWWFTIMRLWNIRQGLLFTESFVFLFLIHKVNIFLSCFQLWNFISYSAVIKNLCCDVTPTYSPNLGKILNIFLLNFIVYKRWQLFHDFFNFQRTYSSFLLDQFLLSLTFFLEDWSSHTAGA